MTTPPAEAPAGSATLAKSGNHKFGEVANVKFSSKGGWIGALKVTALEKAPTSDYKELGVRDDAGGVYYLRYDITYISGKTTFPPEGYDLSATRLTPGSEGPNPALTELTDRSSGSQACRRKSVKSIANASKVRVLHLPPRAESAPELRKRWPGALLSCQAVTR